jgi:pyrroloquinoline quinone biosynthesis protein D
MGERLAILETSVPRLPRGVRLRFDETRKQWIVLAPERVIVPDEIALEVLQRVDGTASVGAISDALAEKYQAPRAEVGSDVVQLLQDLADKGMLVA